MNTRPTPRGKARSTPTVPSVPAIAISEESLAGLVEFFQLLADHSRLRILLTLAQEGEQNVSALCARLGQSQPAVSHHLTRMRRCGLISCRRQGKHNFYSLAAGRLGRILQPLLTGRNGSSVQFQLGGIVLSLASR